MKKKYLYETIYYELKEGILDGTYQFGEQLPTEKEITEKYSVSRLTAKNAISLLVEEKLVSRTPGKGTFVSKNNINQVKNKEKTIGLVFSGFSDAFGNKLLKELITQLEQENYNVLFKFSNESQTKESAAINELIEVRVDALIVLPVEAEYHNPTLLKISLSDFPVVLVDRYLQGIELPYVGTDNLLASYQAISMLIKAGHTNISLIYNSRVNNSSIQDRLKGVEWAYSENDLLQNQDYWFTKIESTYDTEITDNIINEDITHIKQHIEKYNEITAFLALDYLSSELLLLGMNELDKKVSRDFSLIGFDGSLVHSLLPKYSRFIQNEKDIALQVKNVLTQKLNSNLEVGEFKKLIPANFIDFNTIKKC